METVKATLKKDINTVSAGKQNSFSFVPRETIIDKNGDFKFKKSRDKKYNPENSTI